MRFILGLVYVVITIVFSWDNFEPDFLLLGKTLSAGYVPLSAVLHNSEIEKLIKSKSGRVSFSTTPGHSLGVASALAVQNIIINQKKLFMLMI